MRRIWILGVILSFVTGAAFAQGTQSGTISGTVTSSDGAPLPGVTVTVNSDALIGTRSAVSDVNGGYIFKGLSPGLYKVTFELASFKTVEKTMTLDLGASIPANAEMGTATVEETITVTADTPTPLTTTQGGQNYSTAETDKLAVPRTLFGIAQFAPGLTTNTPNATQVTISGSFAYDNVFLIDGVDINDNLFGQPNDLFVEDAVQEVQILTSGISAEYGRFSGGVINAVSKRGGNRFSGSLRANLTNPSWRDETPIEKTQGIERQDKTNKFFEATLGGPIVRDRIWFFGAGRSEKSDVQSTLPETALPFTRTTDQKRYQGKLTAAVNPNHTISASYLRLSQEQFRQTFNFSIEPEHTAFTGTSPNSLFVANYNGVLRPNLFAEVQFSKKKFMFGDFGGTSTNIIDSPYIAQSVLAHYNAPYFDATDPEDRNNRQIAASLSYFLSTGGLGKHDIKVGFENFRSTRTGGNSQSPTSYVFYTDYATDDAGKPLFDSNGFVVPVFTPGVSQIQNWIALRGAQVDLTTNSAYLNDKVALNNHWSLNLGVRAEWATGEATGGIQPVNASRIVPRLGASFDVRGDGKIKLDATYSQYSGKYSETQFANNTNVGNPDFIYFVYTGPEGQGRDFAPGIDPANYSEVLTGGFPTANVFYDPNIKSPVTKEWTGAVGFDLGKGYTKFTYTHRDVSDFVQQFVTTDTGVTNVIKDGVDFGTFANRLWANSSEGERKYDALQIQTRYGLTPRWNVEGHWTLQINNDGNQEGEGQNTPGAPSLFPGFYPELYSEARSYPIGRLNDFQKHRVRIFSTYDLRMGRAGSLDLGLVYRFDSGTAYSIAAIGVALSSVQQAIADSLYPDRPGSQTLFFNGRGTEFFESSHLFDASLTYQIPLVRTLSPTLKFEARNVFNKTPLISTNITVRPDPASPRDNLGLPTGFIRGTAFGTGTSTANYPFPREFFVSFGVRF